jgi:hypothetical protein
MRQFTILVFFFLGTGYGMADPDTHRLAAERLLTVSMTEDSYNSLIEQTLDSQIQANSAIARYRPAMLEFMNRYMGFQAIRGDLVQLYMKYFTETELNDMIRFYETPTGQKALKLVPILFQEGSAIGQRKVQEHMGELEQMIKEQDGTEKE